ncbi:imelysin family protein [uncultured Pseudoteredinibacter sp.]|uniref:imelysin family protein n=1 Tax=uncultured Pseudoteredinibacter sp. TaxID=1641701 RepID=UPI002637B7E1|nr:imelysin family protein [uncultured Pseudoteredinibacter sp.]
MKKRNSVLSLPSTPFLIVLFVLQFCLLGCNEAPEQLQGETITETKTESLLLSQDDELKLKKLVAEYWKKVRVSASDNRQKLSVLNEMVDDFLSNPSDESLTAVKEQWIESYLSYQALATVAQFHLSMPNVYADQRNIWLAIDPYPIAVGYIDDFGPYKGVGIVNDLLVEINETSVRSQHAITDPSEAILGYLPLAFLLWGDNISNAERVDDYKINGNQNIQRRRQLLEVVSTALANDVKVLEQWLSDTGQIDVLFYRLPVLAQIELIKRSSAAFAEYSILAVLQDEAKDDWRPGEIWSKVLSVQVRQLNDNIELLKAANTLPLDISVEAIENNEASTALQDDVFSKNQNARLIESLERLVNEAKN